MVSPVKYDPSGEARKTYAVATSMGIPALFSGAAPTPNFLIASGGLFFVAGWRGVQLRAELARALHGGSGEKGAYMIPGATALILMPFGACCWASALVKVTMAPLVEA